MEASLDDDIERVSSVLNQEPDTTIRVTISATDGRTMPITVAKDEMLHEAVARWLECDDANDLRYVQLGDVTVDDDESFEDAGIEDGARLSVCIEEMTAEEAVERLVAMGATKYFGKGPCSATEVRFMDAECESLPREIFKLPYLERLSVSGCTSLKTLPREIGRFSNLMSLVVKNCTGLKALPQEMAQMANLTMLNLNDCTGLETLPDLSGLPCVNNHMLHTSRASDAAIAWKESGYQKYPPTIE